MNRILRLSSGTLKIVMSLSTGDSLPECGPLGHETRAARMAPPGNVSRRAVSPSSRRNRTAAAPPIAGPIAQGAAGAVFSGRPETACGRYGTTTVFPPAAAILDAAEALNLVACTSSGLDSAPWPGS